MSTTNLSQTIRGKLRSLLLPSELLIQNISPYLNGGKTLLDIGAGTGYFLKLLLTKGLVKHGYGTEIKPQYYIENQKYSIRPIESYNQAFDIISLIDVLHHIPDKKSFFEYIVGSTLLKRDTIIFIKDISPKHLIYRVWNTLHDMIFNHQIPVYISEKDLILLMQTHGYEIDCLKRQRVFLYDHYLIIFKKSIYV